MGTTDRSQTATYRFFTKKRDKKRTSLLGQARELKLDEPNESKNEPMEDAIIAHDESTDQIFIEREEVQGECSICWEEMTNSTTSESREFMLLCGHSFCFKCLHSLCLMSTYDPSLILNLGCPWQDCDHTLDDSEVEFLVDFGTFQDYERNHFLAVKQRDPRTRYCSKPGCSALIDTDDVDRNPQIICPSCKEEYCFHCMRAWHGDGVTCDEIKQLEKKEEPDSAALQFEEWVEQNNAKPCPNCNIMIEKVSGCNHMTCKSCSYAFCWLCLDQYAYGHYASGGKCAGKQFYGSNYSFGGGEPRTYRGDPGNENVVPPPLYVPNRKKKRVKSKQKPNKKRRILALPKPQLFRFEIFPTSNKRNCDISQKRHNNIIKMCLLGDSGVGKSPFVIQFTQNHYVDEYDPTIEDSYRKQIEYQDRVLLLDMLDTCGMEEFTAMRDQWMRTSEAFLIFFSCTRQYSIDNITTLLNQLSRVKDCDIDEIPMIIVGTKVDLDQSYEFDLEEVRRIARNAGASLIFTSARFNINVTETFMELTRIVLEKRAENEI